MPQKQANRQKALERPTVKKLYRKTEGRSQNLIYKQHPFSRTGLKTLPVFEQPTSEKQNDSHAPRGHCLKNLEQSQSRTGTKSEPGKKRLNPENMLTPHPNPP